MKKQLSAVNLAKYTILYGYKHNLFLKKLIKEWNDPTDLITRSAVLQVCINDQYMSALSVIINLLTVKCKHPKKYRDKTRDDVWYCMNCNSDL